jgi:hypothetical protein
MSDIPQANDEAVAKFRRVILSALMSKPHRALLSHASGYTEPTVDIFEMDIPGGITIRITFETTAVSDVAEFKKAFKEVLGRDCPEDLLTTPTIQ